MKQYELALVVKSSLPEADQKNLIKQTRDLIENGGQVTQEKTLGRKTLAYRIDKQENGVFFILNFFSEKSVADSLINKLKIDENILRFLIQAQGGKA